MRRPRLYNIVCTNGKEVVYDDNQLTRAEECDVEKDMIDFLRFIRPNMKYDTIKCTYFKEVEDNVL